MTRRKGFSTSGAPEHLSRHIDSANHYFNNGIKLLRKRDDRKAAEMLWGAAAQLLKAMGLVAGDEPRSHDEIRKFLYNGPAQADPELMTTFLEIEALHHHFYDPRLEHSEIERIAGAERLFLEKLRALLYSQLGPGPTTDGTVHVGMIDQSDFRE